MTSTDLHLIIKPSGPAILQREKGGVKDNKPVELAEVIAELGSGQDVRPGPFPPNTRNWAMSGTTRVVAVELPPGKRDILTIRKSDGSCSQMVVKGAALPAAMFFFVMRQEGKGVRMQLAHMFAMQNDRMIMDQDRLFHYPTPNVYTNTEKITQICWGPGVDGTMPNLLGIEGLIQQFMTSVFNTDLFGTDKTSEQFPWDKIDNYLYVDQYFQLLSKESVFKSEWLLPAPAGYETIQKAFETITKKHK